MLESPLDDVLGSGERVGLVRPGASVYGCLAVQLEVLDEVVAGGPADAEDPAKLREGVGFELVEVDEFLLFDTHVGVTPCHAEPSLLG